MFDVLRTLTHLVAQKRQPKQTGYPQPQTQSQAVSKETVKKETKEVSSSPQVDTELVRRAEAQAKEILLEAKDEAFKIRRQVEEEMRKKLEVVDRRDGSLDEKEKRVHQLSIDAENKLKDAMKVREEQVEKLEKIASLTRDEAKEQLLLLLQDKLKEEFAKEIKESQTRAQEEAEEKSREIIIDAMRHGATDYVAEYTVSVVKISDEDMKGRIIGKEGRNIRAFETATGVDVDLDEEGVIRLSSFDTVRREIARVVLERLMRDGRVQPGRIEELVEQVKKETERIMFEEGQKLCHAVGVYNLPAPLVAMLGRFKFRFSYGQNMIAHTLEETKIGVAIAHDVGFDVNIVRLGCLLHDIGKVVTDKEGSHVDLGVELLKKYGLPQKVVDCVAQHHEDKAFTSLEAVIVYIADAISGGRPGARYENYDEYIKRLADLEGIAKAQGGVKEAFAFQAGRELRVVVDPGKVDDAGATVMAHSIKEEIEKKMTYPGQIKVNVIRELRATEIAK